jgi:hypothetical protein
MQGVSEIPEFFNSSVDVIDPPSQEVANLPAGGRVAATLLPHDQLFDILERQPKRLGLLDESDTI